ncbi:MAG: TonB-dependent receptor [Bacteroidales bacterium]|nr:TonB-dependent receptor [Bacteroidales bacterium]
MKKLSFIIAFIAYTFCGFSQDLTQTIRGKILDKQTQIPVIGANVFLPATNPVIGTITDGEGNFKLENIAVGRHTLQISCVGYNGVTIPNIVVTSAKEVVLEIGIEELVSQLEEIVVTARQKKDPLNKMAAISARSFTVEETGRFAGALTDPARMATAYAGVIAASDQRNDIIIRGNSPLGLLWKLEDINIPNPNHFSSISTTGGGISILNNNNLSNSDFLTGAFPAEYGNALAGVFDLKLKRGNDEAYESMVQVGVTGLELGLEGPLPGIEKSAFIANYRLSTIGIINAMGIVDDKDLPAIPKFQDMTFKVDFPNSSRSGKFTLFGIGGISTIDLKFKPEELEQDEYLDVENQNHYTDCRTGVLGISHNIRISDNSRIKSTVAVTGSESSVVSDTIMGPKEVRLIGMTKSSEVRYILSVKMNNRLNSRNNFESGISLNHIKFNYLDSNYLGEIIDRYHVWHNLQGNSTLYEAYTQWQHKFNDKMVLNSGIHGQFFDYSSKYAIEPRLGFKWTLKDNHVLSIGTGLHSQVQPFVFYIYQTEISPGNFIHTNRNLDFTKSLHFVAGYDHNFLKEFRIKSEVYYQYLYDIPVESHSSLFSMANVGAEFTMPFADSLINKGTGENYGLELTFEKFFSKNYYFLVTSTLFQSKYTGSDGIKRNTVFNSNYTLTALGGIELNITKKTVFLTDTRITFAGGRRYIPVNLTESKIQGYEVLENNHAYKYRLNDYFRLDYKLGFRFNRAKVFHYVVVDIMNVLNTKNIFQKVYNPKTNDIYDVFQYGMIPNIFYRLEF